MKALITTLSYLISLVIIAGISFFVVLVFAGPHAGLLPSWLERVVLALGWLAVLILPVLVARKVWYYLGKSKPHNKSLKEWDRETRSAP